MWKKDIRRLYKQWYVDNKRKPKDYGKCRLCGKQMTKITKARGRRMTCVECARKEDKK